MKAGQAEHSDDAGIETPARPQESETSSSNTSRRRSLALARGPKDTTKASFNLPSDELDALKQLAARRQTTATQVIRQALATELFLQNLVDEGAEIVAKDGKRGREIVFAHMLLG